MFVEFVATTSYCVLTIVNSLFLYMLYVAACCFVQKYYYEIFVVLDYGAY